MIAELDVQLPSYIQQHKRQHSLFVMSSMMQDLLGATAGAPSSLAAGRATAHPHCTLHPGTAQHTQQAQHGVPELVLRGDTPDALMVGNPGPDPIVVDIAGVVGSAQAGPNGADGNRARLPLWLEFFPTHFLLPPHQSVRVMVRGWSAGAAFGSGMNLATEPKEVVVRVQCKGVMGGGLGGAQGPPQLLKVRHVPY